MLDKQAYAVLEQIQALLNTDENPQATLTQIGKLAGANRPQRSDLLLALTIGQGLDKVVMAIREAALLQAANTLLTVCPPPELHKREEYPDWYHERWQTHFDDLMRNYETIQAVVLGVTAETPLEPVESLPQDESQPQPVAADKPQDFLTNSKGTQLLTNGLHENAVSAVSESQETGLSQVSALAGEGQG